MKRGEEALVSFHELSAVPGKLIKERIENAEG